MYKIYVNGKSSFLESPFYYTKEKDSKDGYLKAVLFNGQLYNISGLDKYDESLPTAIIREYSDDDRLNEISESYMTLNSKSETTNNSVDAIMLGQTDQTVVAKTTDDSVNAIMLALTDISSTLATIQASITK